MIQFPFVVFHAFGIKKADLTNPSTQQLTDHHQKYPTVVEFSDKTVIATQNETFLIQSIEDIDSFLNKLRHEMLNGIPLEIPE